MELKPVFLFAAIVSSIGVHGASASPLARHHHEHFVRQYTTSTKIADHRSTAHRVAGSSFTSRRIAGYRVREPSYATYGYAPQQTSYGPQQISYAPQQTSQQYANTASRRFSDGRPAAWCGWEMRHLVGSDPGPEYNLARNWAHWGHAVSGPAPGVIGVMAHHVFKVVSVLGNGAVLAISGNDSHAVRTRPRSTAGVIAWRGV